MKKALSILCVVLLLALLAACGAAGNTPAAEPEPVLIDLPVEENIPDETESTEAAFPDRMLRRHAL